MNKNILLTRCRRSLREARLDRQVFLFLVILRAIDANAGTATIFLTAPSRFCVVLLGSQATIRRYPSHRQISCTANMPKPLVVVRTFECVAPRIAFLYDAGLNSRRGIIENGADKLSNHTDASTSQ